MSAHRFEADSPPSRVALIGAGAVGSALARRLAERGYALRAVISRTEGRAQRLAEQVGAPVASSALEDLPPDAGLVFCCVPDDALSDVAERLQALPFDWTGRFVAHTSGALTARVLDPLARAGGQTLSFHPLQTFVADTEPSAFEDIYIGLEGAPAAVEMGRRLARDLGARALELAPEDKARYHLAASMASNFLVTLMALAGEVLGSIDLDAEERTALLRPLVEATWQNLTRKLPEEALTGPIARGDRETLAAHAATIAAHLSHLTPVYAALAAETVRLAARGGKIDAETADRLLDVLQGILEPYNNSPF